MGERPPSVRAIYAAFERGELDEHEATRRLLRYDLVVRLLRLPDLATDPLVRALALWPARRN